MAFTDLPDNELLLRIHIRPEQLEDPAAWCQELREITRAIHAGPKTSNESHTLMERNAKLFQSVKKLPPAPQMSAEDTAAWEVKLSQAKTNDDFINLPFT